MVKPPRILGEVPPGYHGPIYYRLYVSNYRLPNFSQKLRFEDMKLARAFEGVLTTWAGLRVAPTLFGPDKALLPPFREPIKCRWKSGTPRVPELAQGMFTIVSSRVHDEIEALEPARNIFIPLDIDTGSDVERRYIFYPYKESTSTVTAPIASGIPYFVRDDGSIFVEWGSPPARDPRFIFINSDVIDGRHVYWGGNEGLIFSQALIRRLGDVFLKNEFLIPCGLVSETYGD